MSDESTTPPASDPSGDAVAIVRYPNRRLYDSSQSRYVTLQDIADMVRQGKNVTVRDSKTDDDLTSSILMQIILQQHPERMDLLPAPILHMMIRTNDVVLESLRNYFRQSLQYLDLFQRAAQFNPLSNSLELLRMLSPAAPRLTAAAGDPNQSEDLSRRLAELERRIEALTSATNASPRADAESR